MSHLKRKPRRATVAFLITLSALLLLTLVLLLVLFLSTYFADEDSMDAFADEYGLHEYKEQGSMTVFEAEEATAGFIFYPGGLVDDRAYIPLMSAMAEKGITCILIEMPLNLAVLDLNAANGVREKHPDIEHWYIGGHSLGGAMAASYLEENADDFDGLILLGAYSTADLSDTELAVLSVYGSEDGVMKRDKYSECKKNLPENFTECEIEGANHAYYGMYGEQKGDGSASITNAEQIFTTADTVVAFMELSEN